MQNGVDLSHFVWQSDNGSEFIEVLNRKRGQTLYEQIIKEMKSESVQIPPDRKTYNSDVEAAHRLIEDEFYDIEDYHSPHDFLNKTFTYSVYFNWKL
ncbi:MAG TPA: hypothetical protein DHW42_00425 [Candidatus Marinimicrobia bacterium]|nr:hypothetical protein [Candidatus Neomarinimicrobiota bacterium]